MTQLLSALSWAWAKLKAGLAALMGLNAGVVLAVGVAAGYLLRGPIGLAVDLVRALVKL
jgi:hypothetical protein